MSSSLIVAALASSDETRQSQPHAAMASALHSPVTSPVVQRLPSLPQVSSYGSAKEDAVRFGIAYSQGWRPAMEDEHCMREMAGGENESMWLFGVFDGHGGRVAAEFCTSQMPELLGQSTEFKAGNFAQALRRVFVQTDDIFCRAVMRHYHSRVRRLPTPPFVTADHSHHLSPTGAASDYVSAAVETSCGDAGLGKRHLSEIGWLLASHRPDGVTIEECGSTATLALLHEKDDSTEIIVAGVGDSKSILLLDDGTVLEMTRDHKATDPNECARIKKAGFEVRNGRVNGSLDMSRAIGDLEFKKNVLLPKHEQAVVAIPSISSISLRSNIDNLPAHLIMASDGLWNSMAVEKVAAYVRQRLQDADASLEDISSQLCALCLLPGVTCFDNVTVVIVQIG